MAAKELKKYKNRLLNCLGAALGNAAPGQAIQWPTWSSWGTVRAWTHDFIGDTRVPDGLSNVVAIAAGRYLCLALKSDGTVVEWGETNFFPKPLVPDNLSNGLKLEHVSKLTLRQR
jgi:hypothetical protein